jgi:hypothetical protein
MAATASNPFPFFQPTGGIDFTPGKGFDIASVYKKMGVALGTEPTAALPPTGSALPSVDPAAKAATDFYKSMYPYQRQLLLDTAQIQQQLNEQGFASAYPWISQAAQESTARNLKASQDYRAFVESQPSSVQNIMASKQAQMASAAGSEADRARAMADQLRAAKDFAGRFSGKYISVG